MQPSIVGWSHWQDLCLAWNARKEETMLLQILLSCVISKLDAEVMKSILDRVTIETIGRIDAHDPAVVEANEKIHK